MLRTYWLCIILSALYFCPQLVVSLCPNPNNPGVVAGITQEGLNNVAQIGVSLLQSKFHGSTIPNFSYSRFHTTKIQINTFRVSKYSLTTSTSGLKPSIVVDAAASIDYKYCFWGLCANRNLDASATIQLSADINVGVKDCTYTLSTSQCDASVSNLQISHGGSLGSVLNTITNIFKSKITDVFVNEQQICLLVEKQILTRGNEAIDSFNKTIELFKNVRIDYSLLDSVITESNYAASKLKGEFYCSLTPRSECVRPTPTHSFGKKRSAGHRLIHKRSSPALCPQPIPLTPEPASNCPYYIRTSEYSINTALNAIYECGILQHFFCLPANLIPALKFLLRLGGNACNTPTIANAGDYPEQCDNVIFIKASSAPVVKLEGGKIIFDFGFSVDLLTSSNCNACTITGTARAVGSMSVEPTPSGHRVVGELHAFNVTVHDNNLCPLLKSPFTLGVLERETGISNLNVLYNILAEDLARPQLNKLLANGVPVLTLKHIALKSPKIHLSKGYGTACFDVAYTA